MISDSSGFAFSDVAVLSMCDYLSLFREPYLGVCMLVPSLQVLRLWRPSTYCGSVRRQPPALAARQNSLSFHFHPFPASPPRGPTPYLPTIVQLSSLVAFTFLRERACEHAYISLYCLSCGVCKPSYLPFGGTCASFGSSCLVALRDV